jgi:N-acyl homoserine lactone hydrolase
MILRTPGHTPGHQVLKLQLQKSGTVILSGDLYHLRANRQFKRVPVYNTNRADTLASMSRIETIIRNTGGRLIVQHDPKDFEKLPKPPAFLD